MAKPREREIGWSLKVGSEHLHFHERVTSLMPYMEICLFIALNVTTDIRLEYIAINKGPTKIYDKKGEKDDITGKKNKFNNN